MNSIDSLLTVTCLVTAMLAAGQLRAESLFDSSPSQNWFEHRRENAWLHPYDPTLISRRTLSEFSFEGLDGDEEIWKIENSLRWGRPVAQDLAFGLQFMVPVKWIDTSTADESGIADFELRTGFVGRFSPTLRWGSALNVKFDTATNPAIGDHATVLRPILAVRWDAADHIHLGFNVDYDFTPSDEGVDDESALQVKIPLVIRLTDDWSSAVTYKPRVNFLAGTDRHRLEIGATRLFGSRHQYALSLGGEFPLTPEAFNHKAIAGLAWNF